MSGETWGGSDRLSGAAERFSLGSAGLHQLAESEPSAGPIRPQIFATLQLLSAWCQVGSSSTPPMHPMYTPYTSPIHPINTRYTLPIHLLHTPVTPPIHPLYTPYGVSA